MRKALFLFIIVFNLIPQLKKGRLSFGLSDSCLYAQISAGGIIYNINTDPAHPNTFVPSAQIGVGGNYIITGISSPMSYNYFENGNGYYTAYPVGQTPRDGIATNINIQLDIHTTGVGLDGKSLTGGPDDDGGGGEGGSEGMGEEDYYNGGDGGVDWGDAAGGEGLGDGGSGGTGYVTTSNNNFTNTNGCNIIAETPPSLTDIGKGLDWNQNESSTALPPDPMDSWTNDQLLDRMLSTLTFFSNGDLVPSAKNIWQHFKDKTGSEFQDVPLDDIANKSTTMQDWFSARNKDLKRWLNDVHNDYTSLINQPLDPATDPNFPILDANVTTIWVSGLHTIVGGTQYASICLKTYSFDPLANHYQATCRITISDDFGVSSSDVLAANQQQAQLELALGIFYPGPIPNLVDGIKAFWILQHRRGYPSFIHKIQLTHTFEGSL